MPVCVGIDLVLAATVRDALSTHGEAYLRRVYTPAEISDCGGDPLRLAARFAAKEAALKALGAGEAAVPLTAIEVRRRTDGAPELLLHGKAAALASGAGIGALSVSLTHEGDYAAAVVIGEQLHESDQDPAGDHR